MSNMAPQHHQGFNGSGGLWSHLERWIQPELVLEGGTELWVYAGTVFGLGVPERVGPGGDIHVPPMFFKIVDQRGVGAEHRSFLLEVKILAIRQGRDARTRTQRERCRGGLDIVRPARGQLDRTRGWGALRAGTP